MTAAALLRQLDRAGRVHPLGASVVVAPPARPRGGRSLPAAPEAHDTPPPTGVAAMPTNRNAPALRNQPGA